MLTSKKIYGPTGAGDENLRLHADQNGGQLSNGSAADYRETAGLEGRKDGHINYYLWPVAR